MINISAVTGARLVILTVDRIENGIVVCLADDERRFDFHSDDIGFPVSEGDVLTLSLSRDEETEKSRKSKMRSMLERLKSRENDN